MSRICAMLVVLLGLLLVGANAWADPAPRAQYGPVMVANRPLQVCVGDRCQATPPVTSVAMQLSADSQAGVAGAQSTVTEIACASGVGIAARVTPAAGGATVTGNLTLATADGASVTLPIRQVLQPGSAPVVIQACQAG